MANKIHPTAIISDEVVLGDGNTIGAYTIIEGKVTLGDNNTISNSVTIGGDTTIGNNNNIGSYCVIGSFPEHKKFWDKEHKGVKIGHDNVFKNYVSIYSGCTKDTSVGNGVWILRGGYVAHDCEILDGCVLSANTMLGGYCHLGYFVNMGIGSIAHQLSVIGSYSMIGMGTVITKKSKIEPFNVYIGSPAKWLRTNTVRVQNLSEYDQAVSVRLYNEALEKAKTY